MTKRQFAHNQELEDYFKLPNSPMKNSPVGRLMQAIVMDSPGIAFDDARATQNGKRLMKLIASVFRRRKGKPGPITSKDLEKERKGKR